MHQVNRNSPAPAFLKALAFQASFLLAVFHLSPLPLNAQALGQLFTGAPKVEIPLAPPPANATLYTAAPDLKVYFIDVGQGDAIYLELPGGKNALIDGGPSTSKTSSLANFLKEKNVTAIDHVLLTHPHSDHYNGLQYVVYNLEVGNFYDTRVDNANAVVDDRIRNKVADLGIPTFYPAPREYLDWGAPGVEVKVLSSCHEELATSNGDVLNNCSIVFRLAYKDSSILFTGDLEGTGETGLVGNFGDELRSDVLKVGHHGSKFSSSENFLNVVRPSRAYIEVGADNSYGHPTQEAIDRLIAVGAEIYRTDIDGTMLESFDGGWDEFIPVAD